MPYPIPAQTADIWYIPLSSEQLAIEPFWSVLSRDERSRAQRYHTAHTRRDFVLMRGGLRMILAQYLDQAPCELMFAYGRYGKPYLQQYVSQLAFNLSHTHGWGVCLINACPVGVDIEHYNDRLPARALAKRFFATEEYGDLKQQRNYADYFYKLWTCKEAVLKAQGMRLSCLADVELDLTSDKARIKRLPSYFNQWVIDQWCFNGYYCAAAFTHNIDSWRQYSIDNILDW